MKRLIALIMSALMLLSLLCGCGNTEAPAADAGDGYKVGIVQLMQHVALDQATQGFQDALTEKLGDQVSSMFSWPAAKPPTAPPS